MISLSAVKWLEEIADPAKPQDISMVEEKLLLVLPDVYKEFLLLSNGALGNLVSLYDTAGLVEMNIAYEVQQYAPGYVSVGNDGGGYHLLMKAQEDASEFRLVSSGVGVPSEEDCKDDFMDWLLSPDGDPWRNEEQ